MRASSRRIQETLHWEHVCRLGGCSLAGVPTLRDEKCAGLRVGAGVGVGWVGVPGVEGFYTLAWMSSEPSIP